MDYSEDKNMVSRELLTVSLGKEFFFFFFNQLDTTSDNLGRRCSLFRLGRSVGISVGIVLIMPTEKGRPASFGWNYSLGRRF